jgi:hypothetical protein
VTILRRATDQAQSEWNPVPEGMFRWIIGVPEVKLSEKFGNYQVKFPLMLTEAERKRIKDEIGDPAEGVQQSWRTSYTTGLSLGYIQRDGQFKSTRLIDFLSACLGSSNSKKFREWIASGGGPPRPADKDDQLAELRAIGQWLTWWENLEVYGTISHAADAVQSGVVWARFAGPIAVGSLPGQKDDEYQAHGRGKLRAIIVEAHPELAAEQPAREPVAATAGPAQRFTSEGTEVVADGSDSLPF